MVSFKLGRSPAGGLVQTGEEPIAGGLVQICTNDPRNVQNSWVDNLNIEAIVLDYIILINWFQMRLVY